MEIKIDQTKWWQRIYASLIFFTRLPFWRIYQPPQQCYETVVEHWPFAGWLTGGVMAAVVYFGSMLFPFHIALLLAIAARVLLTGALHEDGLADFFDGFGGGGNDRERIKSCMPSVTDADIAEVTDEEVAAKREYLREMGYIE